MISVIVVSFETGALLDRCLQSVAGLAESGHEVIVVDNASSDGSADRIRRHFGFTRVLGLEENVGFGAANNHAAAVARGEALLLLNPDAWLEEGCAEHLLDGLTQSPRLGLVAPSIFYPNGRLQFNWDPSRGVLGEAVQTLRNRFEGRAWAHRPWARLIRACGDPGWYSASCFLVRRQACDDIGGFDERFFLYFEDADLCSRLLDAGWTMTDVPTAKAFHEKSSASSDQGEVAYRRSQFAYYRKHRPRWESRFLICKQRRRFGRVADSEVRQELLAVLLEAEQALGASGRSRGDG